MRTSEPHGSPTDPYRVFFPLGILMGIAGVSIWPLYYWEATTGYSGRSHAFVQTDCFLYAFIVGFLWTAIPKFTGTSTPSRSAQYVVASLLGVGAVAFELQYFGAGHLTFVAAHAIVVTVAARRFIRRQHPPPETFVFVGVGVLAGMIGAIINAGIAWELVPSALDMVGKRLITEGMVLLLVLGIGGFLGPRLLGFAQLPNFQTIGKLSPQAVDKAASDAPMDGLSTAMDGGPVSRHLALLSEQIRPPLMVRHRHTLYAAAGLALLLSVILEYAWDLPLMAWLRAAIASSLVLVNVQPWRTPLTRTTLAWCVWTAHWLLIAALWLVAIAPKYRIDFLHVMFMGAFTLLILAVGTRVVLSHGGHTLTEERRSWPLRIGLTTGIIAMFARLGAPFTPNTYFSHLAWAAILWIGGMVIWGTYLLRRIRQSEESLSKQ